MGPEQGIYVDLSNSTASAPNKGGNNVDKIKTLVAAGTPPDMYVLAYRISQEFYVTGATVNFDQELRTEPRWAAQRADIFPHMLESSMWTGKVVGMPVSTNNVAFIYNTGLLQQHGVEPPKEDWTLDDFEEKAEKFVTPAREDPLGWADFRSRWVGTSTWTSCGARARTRLAMMLRRDAGGHVRVPGDDGAMAPVARQPDHLRPSRRESDVGRAGRVPSREEQRGLRAPGGLSYSHHPPAAGAAV